jgi:hypothetical protein
MPFYCKKLFHVVRALCMCLLAGGLFGWGAPVVAAASAVAASNSPAMVDLQRMPVGPNAVDAFHWPQAFKELGHAGAESDLRHALLQAWLTELETNQSTPPQSVAQAVDIGRSWPADRLDREGPLRWQAITARWLQPVLPAEPVPLPDDIESLRQDLTEEATGFWAHRQRDGSLRGLFLWLTLVNTGRQPLYVGGFELSFSSSGARAGSTPAWTCMPPRAQARTPLEAGSRTAFLCRLPLPPVFGDGQTPASWLASVRQTRAWQLAFHDFDNESRRQVLFDTLAQRHATVLADFMARNTSCVRQSTCPATRVDDSAQAHTHTPPAGHGWADWADTAIWLAKVLAALGVCAVVYRLGGAYMTVAVVFAVSAYYGWSFTHDILTANWADSWGGLAAIPMAVGGAIAPFLAAGFTAAVLGLKDQDDDGRLSLWGWVKAVLAVIFGIFS